MLEADSVNLEQLSWPIQHVVVEYHEQQKLDPVFAPRVPVILALTTT
jgi:hypothetical protein